MRPGEMEGRCGPGKWREGVAQENGEKVRSGGNGGKVNGTSLLTPHRPEWWVEPEQEVGSAKTVTITSNRSTCSDGGGGGEMTTDQWHVSRHPAQLTCGDDWMCSNTSCNTKLQLVVTPVKD